MAAGCECGTAGKGVNAGSRGGSPNHATLLQVQENVVSTYVGVYGCELGEVFDNAVKQDWPCIIAADRQASVE